MAERYGDANGPAPDDYPLDDPALSAQYRQAAVEQPPAHLDKSILTAAHRAVRARQPLAFSPFASDWHIPVALAAVLVLSVALVLNMREPQAPVLEEPLQAVPAQAHPESTRQAGASRLPARGPASAKLMPQAATPSSGAAPGMSGSGGITPKKAGSVALSRARIPEREHGAIPAFERLFIPDTMLETRSRTQAGAGMPAPSITQRVPRIAEQSVRTPPGKTVETPKVPSPGQAGIEGKTAVKEYSGSARPGPGDTGEHPRVTRFIAKLTGAWSGKAVSTPVGPVSYDISFRPTAGECITGTAHPGSHHTWTFCARDGALSLDFLSDFRGNRTPIRFRQITYKDGVYTFRENTHAFMKVLVHAGNTAAWMKIFHYGKLHVEIRLTRK